MVVTDLLDLRWNSPIILGARNIATAVAAGCTVVFKASEQCPKLHLLLVKIFHKAGLPDGVVNVIQASREKAAEVTEAVISHPAIKKVEFVGSASVGKIIGQVCAKYLKPIFMELGGKGPAIVLDDADLEAAARKCILGGEHPTSHYSMLVKCFLGLTYIVYSLSPSRSAMFFN